MGRWTLHWDSAITKKSQQEARPVALGISEQLEDVFQTSDGVTDRYVADPSHRSFRFETRWKLLRLYMAAIRKGKREDYNVHISPTFRLSL